MTPADEKSLSFFQRVLLTTDGTVTELLSLYTGEAIKVKKLEQAITLDAAPPALGAPPGARLLKRRVLLSGATKNYLYAESYFVFERLSESIQQKLLDTDQPIGLMWQEEKTETYREIIERKIAPSAALSSYFEVASDVPIVSRTYLVYSNKKPFGTITESFPVTYFRDQVR